ncbi:MAG: hypothetical protein QNK05_22560 [Myxococcota bacterium]|nr:hypothetical protein [Myxococcota bacterium]
MSNSAFWSVGRVALLVAFGMTLGVATISAATPAPQRDVGATLGTLESIGLERAQRPAVKKLLESYFRAIGTIQERLATGALEYEEAARQVELAFDHLEQRLGDVLSPAQLTRYRQLKAQAQRRSERRR